MGRDIYETTLRCEKCGREGKKVREENDCGRSSSYFVGFERGEVPFRNVTRSDAAEPCPVCGTGDHVKAAD